jgi:hypothetical protein
VQQRKAKRKFKYKEEIEENVYGRERRKIIRKVRIKKEWRQKEKIKNRMSVEVKGKTRKMRKKRCW